MLPLIVVGGGESATKYFPFLWDDLKKTKADILSINSIFEIMPYQPTIQLWMDEKFFHTNRQKLFDLRSNGSSLYTQNLKIYSNCPNKINTFIKHKDITDYDNKKIFVGQRCLSGMAALSLAVKLHYFPIFLFGYDFYPQNIKQRDVYQNIDGGVADHVKDFDYFKNHINKIYLVGEESKIESFHKIDYNNFLRRIENV